MVSGECSLSADLVHVGLQPKCYLITSGQKRKRSQTIKITFRVAWATRYYTGWSDWDQEGRVKFDLIKEAKESSLAQFIFERPERKTWTVAVSLLPAVILSSNSNQPCFMVSCVITNPLLYISSTTKVTYVTSCHDNWQLVSSCGIIDVNPATEGSLVCSYKQPSRKWALKYWY